MTSLNGRNVSKKTSCYFGVHLTCNWCGISSLRPNPSIAHTSVVTSATSSLRDLPDSRRRRHRLATKLSALGMKPVASNKEQQPAGLEDTSRCEDLCLLGYNTVLSGAFMIPSSCWFLLGLLFDPEAGGDGFLRNSG
jgi:hypothetical protein